MLRWDAQQTSPGVHLNLQWRVLGSTHQPEIGLSDDVLWTCSSGGWTSSTCVKAMCWMHAPCMDLSEPWTVMELSVTCIVHAARLIHYIWSCLLTCHVGLGVRRARKNYIPWKNLMCYGNILGDMKNKGSVNCCWFKVPMLLYIQNKDFYQITSLWYRSFATCSCSFNMSLIHISVPS